MCAALPRCLSSEDGCWCGKGMTFKRIKDICSIRKIKSILKKGLRVKLQFWQSWNSNLDTVGIPAHWEWGCVLENAVKCSHRMWAASPRCLGGEDDCWWGKGTTFRRIKDICSIRRIRKQIDQRYRSKIKNTLVYDEIIPSRRLKTPR